LTPPGFDTVLALNTEQVFKSEAPKILII